MTSDGRQPCAAMRGSDTEAWLKRWRDLYAKDTPAWQVVDNMLDDYRLHADCGVCLCWDVPTGEGWDY